MVTVTDYPAGTKGTLLFVFFKCTFHIGHASWCGYGEWYTDVFIKEAQIGTRLEESNLEATQCVWSFRAFYNSGGQGIEAFVFL